MRPRWRPWSPARGALRTETSHHEPVLGTVLSFTVAAPGRHGPEVAETILLAEIRRLEAIYSIYLAGSELSTWKQGEADEPASAELLSLLTLGLQWQRRTGGLFNPSAGVLSQRWKQAAADGCVPSAEELAELTASIAEPRYGFTECALRKFGDCSALDFNALAKGLIVDLAARRVTQEITVERMVVNIGGDLVHSGQGGAQVAIENPLRPFDNEPPLMSVVLRNGGMATSGFARCGLTINGRAYSHVIDPRTGQPAQVVASASVIAPDAATADVIATVLSILAPEEGLQWAGELAPELASGTELPCCIVAADGAVHTNAAWDAITL